MQVVTLRPRRQQIRTQMLCLALCALGMLFSPGLCLPLAMLMPLFACPLSGLKQQWAAYAASLAPSVLSLVRGIDPLYSLSLLLVGCLPLLVCAWLKRKGSENRPETAFAIILAYFAATLAVAACARHMFGGSITNGITQLILNTVKSSDSMGSTLYTLATYGLISLPDGYRQASAISFLLDQALISQMMMSLRLTLTLLTDRYLPSLLVQACITGGLFASLRAQKLRHTCILVQRPNPAAPDAKPMTISMTACFRMLQLPPSYRWAVWLTGLAALIMAGSQQTFVALLGTVALSAVQCALQLVGAAVLISLLAARHEEYGMLYGLLAAALYLLFPGALFLLGLCDTIFHLRNRKPKQEEDSL